MSKHSTSSWINGVFRELGVMMLAVVLASLPFAVAAQAQTAQRPAPVWTILANGVTHVAERAV